MVTGERGNMGAVNIPLFISKENDEQLGIRREAPPNKALQRTLDPSTFFAAAKNASASSAAELRR